MDKLFTPSKRAVYSGFFTNLSAGWFGVVLIVPGITGLSNPSDWIWLTKNVVFGIVALLTALKICEEDL